MRDCPTLLSLYVEALKHPVLGKLLRYLICFKHLKITLAVPEGASTAKDFEQLFQLFEIEIKKHISIHPLIDTIINEMINLRMVDNNSKDFPEEKISSLIKLLQCAGKRYFSSVRAHTTLFTKDAKEILQPEFTFYECEKTLFTKLKRPANQLAWQRIKESIKDQPLELDEKTKPLPKQSLIHVEYWKDGDCDDYSEYSIASLFHKILYEIAYKKAVFPETQKRLMLTLTGIIASDRMAPFLPPKGRYYPGSEYKAGAESSAIKIGDIMLFKAIVQRMKKSGFYWKKGKRLLEEIANTTTLSQDTKVQMILIVFDCDPKSYANKTLFNNAFLRDAYVIFVANIMQDIGIYLTKDTTGLVQAYLDGGFVTGLARMEITRRLLLFAPSDDKAPDRKAIDGQTVTLGINNTR